jgi:hypothetical protein
MQYDRISSEMQAFVDKNKREVDDLSKCLRLRFRKDGETVVSADPRIWPHFIIRPPDATIGVAETNFIDLRSSLRCSELVLWIPDFFWGHLVPFMLCPKCGGQAASNGWNSKGARRVVGFFENYYVICKQYKCKASACHHNFNGYDQAAMALLPKFISEKFPCQLTHRGGIDNRLLYFLEKSGCSPTSFGSIEELMKEMHHRSFYKECNGYYAYLEFMRGRESSVVASSSDSGSGAGASSLGVMPKFSLSIGKPAVQSRLCFSKNAAGNVSLSISGSSGAGLPPTTTNAPGAALIECTLPCFGDIESDSKYAEKSIGSKYLRDRYVEHFETNRREFQLAYAAKIALGACLCFVSLFCYVCFLLFPITAEGNQIWQGDHTFKVTAFLKKTDDGTAKVTAVYSIMNAYSEIIAQKLCYKKGGRVFSFILLRCC